MQRARLVGRSRGFSLVETLFALAIFVAGTGVLVGLFLLGGQTVRRSRANTMSAILAQQKIEQLRGAPPDDSPEDALDANAAGYWDLVDGGGHGAGPGDPATYIRRWAVRAVDAASGAIVIQVRVTPADAAGGLWAHPEGVLLETVVERAIP